MDYTSRPDVPPNPTAARALITPGPVALRVWCRHADEGRGGWATPRKFEVPGFADLFVCCVDGLKVGPFLEVREVQ